MGVTVLEHASVFKDSLEKMEYSQIWMEMLHFYSTFMGAI